MNRSGISLSIVTAMFAWPGCTSVSADPMLSLASGSTRQVSPRKSCCRQSDVIPLPVIDAELLKTDTGQHLAEAKKHFELRDYTNAFIESRQALQASPDLYVCHYMVAAVLMALADFAGASKELQEAIEIDASAFDGHFLAGQAYRLRGMYHEAAGEYKSALKCKSNSALVHAYIAECYRVAAIDWPMDAELAKARALDPELPLVYTIEGQRHMDLGKITLSQNAYEKAISIAPNDPYVHFRFGQALGTAEKWQRAEQEVRKALELAPDYAEARVALSWLLGRQKKYSAAIRAGKEALALAPGDAEAHINQARWYNQSGQPELAVGECKIARSLDPDNVWYQRALANSLSDANRIDEAIAEMLLVSQRMPMDEDVKLELQAMVQKKKKALSMEAEHNAYSRDGQGPLPQ